MTQNGKILVTGGTGYIGSHTVVELQNLGYEVLILDNLSNSYATVLKQVERITGKQPLFHQVEMCDERALQDFFSNAGKIDAVIHFAAWKAVGESVEKPLQYYRNNMVSLFNLLDCMEINRIPAMVFSSSCTVYGQPDKLPVAETAPMKKPESPYGQTKQMAEQVLTDVVKNRKIKVISLRYFNPIGAHDSGWIGEYPIGVPNNLVPMITQTAIGKREKLQVFGNDYDTKDGSCIRDFIHVVDIARAHVIAIKRLLQQNHREPFEVFNLGTGHGFTVLETIKTFEKVSGLKLPYEITGRRSGDVEKVYADTTLAGSTLGWKAERSLENMLETAWKWEQYLNEHPSAS